MTEEIKPEASLKAIRLCGEWQEIKVGHRAQREQVECMDRSEGNDWEPKGIR